MFNVHNMEPNLVLNWAPEFLHFEKKFVFGPIIARFLKMGRTKLKPTPKEPPICFCFWKNNQNWNPKILLKI